MAVCVGVIGKDNAPLYLKSRSSSSSSEVVEYQYIISSALDIVEERVSSAKTGLPSSNITNSSELSRELYLGSLSAQQDYKVYGYMTNTRIKFILIVEEFSIPVRENDIRTMFRKLHGGFCDLMSNPFITPGMPITSPKFCAVVDSILKT